MISVNESDHVLRLFCTSILAKSRVLQPDWTIPTQKLGQNLFSQLNCHKNSNSSLTVFYVFPYFPFKTKTSNWYFSGCMLHTCIYNENLYFFYFYLKCSYILPFASSKNSFDNINVKIVQQPQKVGKIFRACLAAS